MLVYELVIVDIIIKLGMMNFIYEKLFMLLIWLLIIFLKIIKYKDVVIIGGISVWIYICK